MIPAELSSNETSLFPILNGLVERYFSLNQWETAKFYIERLKCESVNNDKALQIHCNYLLAQVYYRMNKPKQSYLILKELDILSNDRNTYKDNTSIENEKMYSLKDCRYLFALICLTLNLLDDAYAV